VQKGESQMSFLLRLFGKRQPPATPDSTTREQRPCGKAGEPLTRAEATKDIRETWIEECASDKGDKGASELFKILLWFTDHSTTTLASDLLKLLGAAIREPSFFYSQPLTRCAPGMVVELPDGSKELALEWLGENVLGLRDCFHAVKSEYPAFVFADTFLVASIAFLTPRLPNRSEKFQLATSHVLLTTVGHLLGDSFTTLTNGELPSAITKSHEDNSAVEQEKAVADFLRRYPS
jgi:hypothetical protein